MKKMLTNKALIFFFVAPGLLLFTGFVVYPLISTVFFSFHESDGLSVLKYIGFENYSKLLKDTNFVTANLSSVFLSALAIAFDAVLGIATAILMQSFDKRLQKVLRIAFLIPMVLSISVISQLWLSVYHPDWGLLNRFLDFIGMDAYKLVWLGNEKTAMICIAIVGMWWIFGLMVLLAYSGLKTIPEVYYEAARIDGAGFIQSTIHITLPLLGEVIRVCIILAAVGGLYTFPQVYIMTGGGPGNLTETVMMYMYKEVFSNQRFGLGSAVAVIAIIETLAIISLLSKAIPKRNYQF
ncbi:MAG: sugar ABC transporter permease [Chlorobium sp.]|nr:sugar ABC transporter permease [Chlorobium sp.]